MKKYWFFGIIVSILLSAANAQENPTSTETKQQEKIKLPILDRQNIAEALIAMNERIAFLTERIAKLEQENQKIASLTERIAKLEQENQSLKTRELELTDALGKKLQFAWGSKGWAYDEKMLTPDNTTWSAYVAWAKKPSFDGSFFEFSDEGVVHRHTVTIFAEEDVMSHQIPIDVLGVGLLFVDGKAIGSWGNAHVNPTINLSRGYHQVDIIVNNAGVNAVGNCTAIGIGPCLWGTNSHIRWIKAGN